MRCLKWTVCAISACWVVVGANLFGAASLVLADPPGAPSVPVQCKSTPYSPAEFPGISFISPSPLQKITLTAGLQLNLTVGVVDWFVRCAKQGAFDERWNMKVFKLGAGGAQTKVGDFSTSVTLSPYTVILLKTWFDANGGAGKYRATAFLSQKAPTGEVVAMPGSSPSLEFGLVGVPSVKAQPNPTVMEPLGGPLLPKPPGQTRRPPSR